MPIATDAPWRAYHHQQRVKFSRLINAFAVSDQDARYWQRAGRLNMTGKGVNALGETATIEFPDCDVMTRRFTTFARALGYDAVTVVAGPPEPQPWYDKHWFTVIEGCAIDWTARQFYNVAHDRADWFKPTELPTPLLFAWPGDYPVPGMAFVEIRKEGS